MFKRIKKRIARAWCWLTHSHTKIEADYTRTRQCNHCHRSWSRKVNPYGTHWGLGR